jgi:hypothetical protein
MDVVVRMDNRRGTAVKGNNGGGWSSDAVVLSLVRRQNGGVIEWWREWPRLRWHFHNSGGWMGVRQSKEGGQRWWCRFNTSVLARERRWHDEVLPKDETEAVSLSWLHGKEMWHGVVVWWRQSEDRCHQGRERDEMMTIRPMQILLGRKWGKFTWLILLLQVDDDDLKQRWVIF